MFKSIKKILGNKLVKWPLIILSLWIITHVVYISIDGFKNYGGKADVAVILGNKVDADGSLSPWLKGRVDKALELYKKGRVKKIFASGGISAVDEGSYPEGDAMKEYLIAKGVPAEDIIADNKGENTYLTARSFKEWNRYEDFQSAIIVSQFYHMTRAKYAFKEVGFDNVYSVASDHFTWRDIISTLREVPAFYKYLFMY